jgi:hypothetical protein
MSLRKVRVVVVMPVGPADDGTDTIRSALHYLGPSRAIVVVDDTGDPSRRDEMHALGSDVHVIPSSGDRGKSGGLFLKIAGGYRYAIERFDFDVLLRMDADALVIGSHPEEDALRAFATHPRIGLLGSFRVRTDGVARDMEPAAKLLRHEAGWLGIRNPWRWRTLRGWLRKARANGYRDGEHALGGAYFHRRECVDHIAMQGWLARAPLASSKLGEDHLMSLLTVAAGWKVGDFGGPDDILALRWRGLPMHPDELLLRQKKITHSTRAWMGMEEQAVRARFAAARRHGGVT